MEENNQIILKPQETKESPKKILIAGIPEHISDNRMLADAISILPPHYNF
jgi:hypothetical protein